MNGLRFLPSSVHGVVDYVVGIALLLAPMLFGFEHVGGPAVWVPRVLGILVLGQSVMTDYELSLVKMIPFQMHLWMDTLVGVVLIVSPWAFGSSSQGTNAWLPHVVVGVAEVMVVLISQPWAYGRRAAARA